MAIAHPAEASASAMPSPMPRPEPVINATFPSMRNFSGNIVWEMYRENCLLPIASVVNRCDGKIAGAFGGLSLTMLLKHPLDQIGLLEREVPAVVADAV